MKKIIYIFLITLLTIGCEKTIEFKGGETAPMLVVNSIISPDSTLLAEVSESHFFLDDFEGTKYVENANFDLFVNGENKGKLVRFPSIGTYGSYYKVSPGDEVRIEVSAEGFVPVTGSTTMPPRPEILQVDTSSTVSKMYDYHGWGYNSTYNWDTIGEYTSKNIRFSMKFKDNGDEKNYYRMVVKKRTYPKKENQGGLIYDGEYIENYLTYFDDIVFQTSDQSYMSDFEDIFGGGSIYNSYYNLFSDELINGKEYELKFGDYITLDYISYKDDNNPKRDNPERTVYYIFLQEVSPEYYQYVRSVASARNVDGNPFVEPVQVRSNITNGIGLFGSYTSSKAWIVEFKH